MDWSVDLVWRSGGGTRFDSRGAQITFLGHVGKAFSWIFTHVGACWGTLLRGVGVTFFSGWGSLFHDFSDVFGNVWEGLGDLFGQVWEGFGKQIPTGYKNQNFQTRQGIVFLSRGLQNIMFNLSPVQK